MLELVGVPDDLLTPISQVLEAAVSRVPGLEIEHVMVVERGAETSGTTRSATPSPPR